MIRAIGHTPNGPSTSASPDSRHVPCPQDPSQTPMRRLLYQDESRLEYGRRFWRDPSKRDQLLRHWLDERHPYAERFRERWLPLVDRVLRSRAEQDDVLDAALQSEGLSLRVVVKEIPPVFGSFFVAKDPTIAR